MPHCGLSFRHRVIVFTVLAATVMTLAIDVAFNVYQARQHRETVVAALSSLAQVVEVSAVGPLLSADPQEARRTLLAAAATPSVVECGLYDGGGALFAEHRRSTAPVPRRAPGAYVENDDVLVVRDVVHKGRHVGTLYLRSSLAEQRARLWQGVGLGASVLACVLLGAFFLAVRIHHALSRPLNALAALTREVSKRRDYSLRSPDAERNDEVGVLARGFNDMLDRIQVHETRLKSLQRELERLVQDQNRELREQRGKARLYLDTAGVILVALDPEGRVAMINRKGCEITGYAEAELLGKDWFNLVIPAEERTRVWLTFQEIVSGKESHMDSFENAICTKGGECRSMAWNHAVVRDPAGGIVGMISSGSDITARLRMENDLQEANQRLSEAVEELNQVQEQVIQRERLNALGRMASGIAHDFNNALMPILGFSDMLLVNPGSLANTDEAVGMIRDIRDAALDARSVVQRLREFYRPADRKEMAPLDVNAVLNRVVDLTRPKWKEEMSARGVHIEVCTELGAVPLIEGSETQLRQAVTNLVLNAVDAMPRGGAITISSRVEGRWVLVEVVDTGVGMSAEVKRRCLEPFFTTKGPEGSGLGLSMVFGIVSRHGGSLEVQSELGKGARVTLRFP